MLTARAAIRRRSLALVAVLVATLLVAAAGPATAARFRPAPARSSSATA